MLTRRCCRYYCLEEDDNGVPIKRAKRHLLPEEVKSAFRIKELLCKEYKDLSEREEREIFQRVQLGIPLTQAEAFRATQGEWQTFAQMYEQNFSKVVNRKLIFGCHGGIACTDNVKWS